MSDLVRSSFSGSLTRQAAREVARGRDYGLVFAAANAAKVEAVTQVTEAAMLATAHISALEELLISRSPHAEARLRHIADSGTAGMSKIVLKTGSAI